jgi:hypothetical protein
MVWYLQGTVSFDGYVRPLKKTGQDYRVIGREVLRGLMRAGRSPSLLIKRALYTEYREGGMVQIRHDGYNNRMT